MHKTDDHPDHDRIQTIRNVVVQQFRVLAATLTVQIKQSFGYIHIRSYLHNP